MGGCEPRAREDSVRPRRLSGGIGRPLNFTVRPHCPVLTKNEALELVRQRLPEGSAVLEDATVERSYGWLFFAQPKEYIRRNVVWFRWDSG